LSCSIGGGVEADTGYRAVSRTPELPVFIAEFGDRAARPGVERGHHLRAVAVWVNRAFFRIRYQEMSP
jgi:hypothetical protein